MIQIDLDKIVPIEDLPNKLSQVVDDAHGGAIYVITKEDRPTVALVSIDQLEGLSGRKVVTPMGEETTQPAPAAPEATVTGMSTEPTAALPQTTAPAPDLSTPMNSVQRDLTPPAGPPPTPATPPPAPTTPPPPPPTGTTPPPPPATPDKPLDEMPL